MQAADDPIEAHFPPEELACLREHYERARSILEYGSGGSTWLAASLPGKAVASVESDPLWAAEVQGRIDRAGLPSPVVVWPVDIGPVGPWGRPVDESGWRRFHLYPLGIWDQPFLRHPDVVLIDGRFRPGCLAATCLRIERPVTVLFDDYRDRPGYHLVERFAGKPRLVGRLAVFEIAPNTIQARDWTMVAGLFGHTSLAR